MLVDDLIGVLMQRGLVGEARPSALALAFALRAQVVEREGVLVEAVLVGPVDRGGGRDFAAVTQVVGDVVVLEVLVARRRVVRVQWLRGRLFDVRRILKNTQSNKGNEALGKESGQQSNTNQKRNLITLHGVEQFYKKKDLLDRTLIFESRFESGNLASALKVSDTEYHLLLQNDVNTSGHTQWFFFRVQNTKKYHEARFNMLNLSKPDSLYNEGMKVLIYSERTSEDKDIGWHRGGHKISYY